VRGMNSPDDPNTLLLSSSKCPDSTPGLLDDESDLEAINSCWMLTKYFRYCQQLARYLRY
jgi:hypothetical protein